MLALKTIHEHSVQLSAKFSATKPSYTDGGKNTQDAL